MSQPTKKALTRLFQIAGAEDPAGWAGSELDEGIPQLGRFLFLRQLWRAVVNAQDASWLQAELSASQSHPDWPSAARGRLLASVLSKGVPPDELIELVRQIQEAALHDMVMVLDDPALEEPELQEMQWGLYEMNADFMPVRPLEALHESIYEIPEAARIRSQQPAV